MVSVLRFALDYDHFVTICYGESNGSSEVETQTWLGINYQVMFFIYIARCQDNSLYVGSTGLTPPQRIDRHNAAMGAKWFIEHGPGRLVYSESFQTLLEARRREAQIKRWARGKKERLVIGLKP